MAAEMGVDVVAAEEREEVVVIVGGNCYLELI